MPDTTQYTSVQLDLDTDRKLKAVAAAHERSKAAQIRYWIQREYAELARLKLLPAAESGDPAEGEPEYVSLDE